LTHIEGSEHNLRDLKPYQIVSLLDMVEYPITELIGILNRLVAIKESLEKKGHPELTEAELDAMARHADRADLICAECEIDVSYYTNRVRHKVSNPASFKPAMASLVNELRHCIVRELKDRKFMFVPQAEAEYYDHAALFGYDVKIKFSEANKEITIAGNCYATGNYTACVFHLMRAVEIAARVMVRDLKVRKHLGGKPLELCDWGTLIAALDKGVNTLMTGSRTSLAKRLRLEFYSHAVGSFRNFKNAWRNHVSHTRELYGPGQAKDIMDNTRQFMQHLAMKLQE
jgi:hypothetical protein